MVNQISAQREDNVLEVGGLRTVYVTRRGIRAMDGANLGSRRGEALGLVGEDGVGKNTLAHSIHPERNDSNHSRLVEPPLINVGSDRYVACHPGDKALTSLAGATKDSQSGSEEALL